MSIRLAVTLAISLLILGASYAFADGVLNDAWTTGAHSGVGNYLFWSMQEESGKNELVNNAATDSPRRKESELSGIARTLKSDSNLRALIVGHSDYVGPLSRAEAVVRNLNDEAQFQ